MDPSPVAATPMRTSAKAAAAPGTSAPAAIPVGWRSEPAGAPACGVALEPLAPGIRSPATEAFCARTFVIRAPFGFRCRIRVGETGAGLEWIDNPTGRPPWEIFALTPRHQWSAPDRPSIQWLVNSLLVADEVAWAETLAPFLSPAMRRWPGVLLPGALDIQRWTRPFQWVFEWHDTERELAIAAGEPILYVRLHAPDPDARFQPVPLEDSPELRQAIVRCAKLAQFQRNALAQIDAAYARRPPRLLDVGR